MGSRRFRLVAALAIGGIPTLASADISYNFTGVPWGAGPINPTASAGTPDGVLFQNLGSTPLVVGTINPILNTATAYSGNVLQATNTSPNATNYDALGLSLLVPTSQISFNAIIRNPSAAYVYISNDYLAPSTYKYVQLTAQGLVLQASATVSALDLTVPDIFRAGIGFADSSFNHLQGPYTFALDNLVIANTGGSPPNTSDLKIVMTGANNTLDIYALKDVSDSTMTFGVQYASGTDTTHYHITDQLQTAQVNLADPFNFNATSSVIGTIMSAGGPFATTHFVRYSRSTAGNFTERFTLTNDDNSSDSVLDNTGTVSVHIYDTPILSANNSSTIDTSSGQQTLSVQNLQNSIVQQVGAQLVNVMVSGVGSSRFHVTNQPAGAINGGQSHSMNVSFDTTGNPLNGTYNGVVHATYGNTALPGGQALNGSYFQNLDWYVLETIAGQVQSGAADVSGGSSLAGLGLSSTGGTSASLRAGTAGASTTVSMNYSNGNFSILGGGQIVGDVLNLQGTDGTAVLLEMIIPAAQLSTLTPTEKASLALMWQSSPNVWELARVGDHLPNQLSQYAGDHTADDALTYLSTHSLTLANALGFYGLGFRGNGDASVWAIVDHNSDFGGGFAPIPEPSVLGIAAVTAAGSLSRRRRQFSRLDNSSVRV